MLGAAREGHRRLSDLLRAGVSGPRPMSTTSNVRFPAQGGRVEWDDWATDLEALLIDLGISKAMPTEWRAKAAKRRLNVVMAVEVATSAVRGVKVSFVPLESVGRLRLAVIDKPNVEISTAWRPPRPVATVPIREKACSGAASARAARGSRRTLPQPGELKPGTRREPKGEGYERRFAESLGLKPPGFRHR